MRFRSSAARKGVQAEQAAEKLKMLSFRGMFPAEEALFSKVSMEEGFLAEFIPAPAGARNVFKKEVFPQHAKPEQSNAALEHNLPSLNRSD
jgi:hypothetical protein